MVEWWLGFSFILLGGGFSGLIVILVGFLLFVFTWILWIWFGLQDVCALGMSNFYYSGCWIFV